MQAYENVHRETQISAPSLTPTYCLTMAEVPSLVLWVPPGMAMPVSYEVLGEEWDLLNLQILKFTSWDSSSLMGGGQRSVFIIHFSHCSKFFSPAPC